MEKFFWFETMSGKYPSDFVAVIQFRWVAMQRDITNFEVDNMRMAFIFEGTRDEMELYLLRKGVGMFGV